MNNENHLRPFPSPIHLHHDTECILGEDRGRIDWCHLFTIQLQTGWLICLLKTTWTFFLASQLKKGQIFTETWSLQSANGIVNDLGKATSVTWKTCYQIAPGQGEEGRGESKRIVMHKGASKDCKDIYGLCLARGRQNQESTTF